MVNTGRTLLFRHHFSVEPICKKALTLSGTVCNYILKFVSHLFLQKES
jgi:hypothetical protein